MSTKTKILITVEAIIKLPLEKVWTNWTRPEHIVNWNYALDSWHTPKAESDLKPGGKFSYRMEARDGSMGFDFWGVYTTIWENELIEYTLGDDRKVRIIFSQTEDSTTIKETFEAETQNPVEMQRTGWQAILDNFKKYSEKKTK